ncbi:PilW family protein [Sporolactobacillus terrae]|uniref:PilW family protein n=1 Tax=Sporolactobacillus terrae TaxID=269673 RepID=UPI00048BD5AB|nr:prepilin-type N-terminal cleavage/methylation domain-containing protein [Sporolactobacillus terrae]
MIHNSRGVTLVEMLAAITIATICFVLIFSIWLSGEKSAQHTITENDLQADAHLVQARITRAFYEQKDNLTLTIDNGEVILATGKGSSSQQEHISSPDLFYSGDGSELQDISDDTGKFIGTKLTIDYVIKKRTAAGSADNEGPSFHLSTTLNYPWEDVGEREPSDAP